MSFPESDEVRAQHEADASWMEDASDALLSIFENAMSRPKGYQAYIAGLMDGYTRRLLASAYEDLA